MSNEWVQIVQELASSTNNQCASDFVFLRFFFHEEHNFAKFCNHPVVVVNKH